MTNITSCNTTFFQKIVFIKKLITRKKTNDSPTNPSPTKKCWNNACTTITYRGLLLQKVTNTLSTFNIKITSNLTIIYRIHFTMSETTDKLNKFGAWRLKCSTWNSVYVDHPWRNFKIRYGEHYRSFRHKKEDSIFSKHCLENWGGSLLEILSRLETECFVYN